MGRLDKELEYKKWIYDLLLEKIISYSDLQNITYGELQELYLFFEMKNDIDSMYHSYESEKLDNLGKKR